MCYRNRWWCFTFAGFLWVFLLSASAAAQEQTSSDQTPTAQAKEAYEKARQAADAGSYDEAIVHLKDVLIFAREADNNELARNVHSNIISMYLNLGKQLLDQGDYEAAIARYEEAIAFAPEESRNYFMKGVALKQVGQPDAAVETYSKAMNLSRESGNASIERKAKNNIAAIYLARADQAFQGDSYQTAIDHLEASREYIEPSASIHFQYARAYNELDEYEYAIDHARQGLQRVNPNNRTEQSNLYFALGTAYKNLANKEEAVEAFQNVTAGPYKQNAQYELEHNLESQ